MTVSPGAQSREEATVEGEFVNNLQCRVAELSEAVAARDTFIAVAAHELRNPMTPMIGQIDLLLKGIRSGRHSPEQVEQRLERVRLVMEHYVKRAAVLLDVSRITSGRLRLEPVPYDFCLVMRQVVEAFAALASHGGTYIGIDAPASLLGVWDPLALEQIIDNLVSNAIKYGARTPIGIRVEDLGSSVCLRVRDHGPGISDDDRARIFGRFEQAAGVNERHSGFGVGLWVVGQLVEAMQGTIVANNASDGGAVFSVTLPRLMKGAHA